MPIENCKSRARSDRDGHGGGLIEFVKRGIICKRVKIFETVIWESICSDITISREKSLYKCTYRLPNFNKLDTFFNEVSDSLSKASLTYENLVIIGDFHIDINNARMKVDTLNEFCNLFDITNLIKTETCCTKNQKSRIVLFLTNRPLSFKKTRATKTRISDYHKLISAFLKSHYTSLKSKINYCKTIRVLTRSFFSKVQSSGYKIKNIWSLQHK